MAVAALLSVCAFAQQGALKTVPLAPAQLPQKDITVAEPFDGWKALRALYPGNYYKDADKQLISWSCPACDSKTYLDINGDSGEGMFPFSDGVSTRLIKVYSVKDSTGEYRYLAFNHSIFDEDGFQTSRFTGGVLGIAKFAKSGNAWILRSLTPAVGGYGAFQQCPTPEIITIGDNQYAFLLTHINGGAGGPFDGQMVLIAGVGGRYRQVMLAVGVSSVGGETANAWESHLAVVPGKKVFRDLSITTKGTYSMAEDGNGPPRGVQHTFKGRLHYRFTITTHYACSDSKGYQQMGEPVVNTKAK